jgi:glycosyltransferase involved in cell wall biosynthesis
MAESQNISPDSQILPAAAKSLRRHDVKIGLYISDIVFRVGGTESYAAHLIYALQMIYHNPGITVVSETYDHDIKNNPVKIHERFNTAFGTAITPDNLNFNMVYADKNNFVGRASFESRLNRLSKNFDLFINCSMNLFRFSAKKNIVIVHFPPQRKIHSDFVKKFPFFVVSALYKDLIWSSAYDLYIANSLYTKKWLNRIWHIKPSRSALLNPPVAFVKTAGETKLDYIMICSRLEPSKEIDLLARAFLSSPVLKQSAKLCIAGASINENAAYVHKLKALIKDRSDIVQLIENPNREEIEHYYSMSKIFWHAKGYSCDEDTEPAELEHFGITTVEAMSAGCVPVVINKGGQKEIVHDGENGFLWDTPRELIEKTVFLLQNPEKFRSMSKAARETIETYSFEEFTKKLKLLLEQGP